MRPTHPTRDFLARHTVRSRNTPLLWSAVAILAAVAQVGLARLGWWSAAPAWIWVPLIAAASLLFVWLLRARKSTPRQLARKLDSRWALRARLESAVELSAEESAWSAAQRDDAAQALAGRSPPGSLVWHGGQLALVCMAFLLLVEAGTLAVRLLRSWHFETIAKPLAAQADVNRSPTKQGGSDQKAKTTANEKTLHGAASPAAPATKPAAKPMLSQAAERELESLALRQQKENGELAGNQGGGGPGTGPDKDAGAGSEASIAHDAARMAASGSYDPETRKAITYASAEAAAAARQLEVGDLAAARVPAAAAQRALETALEDERQAGLPSEKRNPIARRFNPAEVDPLYRDSVAAYFERLSRDGSQPAPTQAK